MSYVKGAAFEAIRTAKRILKERKKDQSPRSEMYSSFSISFVSRETDSDRSVNTQLWSNVDVSLKDGMYLGEMTSTPRSVIENSETQGPTKGDSRSLTNGDSRSLTNGFSRSSRSATPSPQRSRSYVSVENMNLFMTLRKQPL
ncbi:hypothetical protein Tco_0866368 [Tanacetum coccineum]